MSGVFDAHIHIQPWEQMKPGVLATMKEGHDDFEALMGYSRSPDAFLKHLDSEGIEKAVLVNYVSPDLMGFTDAVNPYSTALTSATLLTSAVARRPNARISSATESMSRHPAVFSSGG